MDKAIEAGIRAIHALETSKSFEECYGKQPLEHKDDVEMVRAVIVAALPHLNSKRKATDRLNAAVEAMGKVDVSPSHPPNEINRRLLNAAMPHLWSEKNEQIALLECRIEKALERVRETTKAGDAHIYIDEWQEGFRSACESIEEILADEEK